MSNFFTFDWLIHNEFFSKTIWLFVPTIPFFTKYIFYDLGWNYLLYKNYFNLLDIKCEKDYNEIYDIFIKNNIDNGFVFNNVVINNLILGNALYYLNANIFIPKYFAKDYSTVYHFFHLYINDGSLLKYIETFHLNMPPHYKYIDFPIRKVVVTECGSYYDNINNVIVNDSYTKIDLYLIHNPYKPFISNWFTTIY